MNTIDKTKAHVCKDGKMPPPEIAGSIIPFDGQWYQVKGINSNLIRNCPHCGARLL